MGTDRSDLLRAFRSIALEALKPKKWTKLYWILIRSRNQNRIDVLRNRLEAVTKGRVMPVLADLPIGGARRFEMAILFLDICGFSKRPNSTETEQKTVLAIMNTFMAEMLNIVLDFGGHYEKNTGDGLMAYFGESLVSTRKERVARAVEAAVVMHAVNDHVFTPIFSAIGIPPVRFRVGIDFGHVTVARIGIRETTSRVAIGTAANVACKLMNLIPEGGICIGDSVYGALPAGWDRECTLCEKATGYVNGEGLPYRAWTLDLRLNPPI